MIENPPKTGINIKANPLVYISEERRAWRWAAQWALLPRSFFWPLTPTSPASCYRVAVLHMVVKFHEQVLRSLCLPFLTFHSPVSALQSVFCSVHCTETSRVKKICDAGATGSCSVASLPDLLALDTVNNQALLLVSHPGHCSLYRWLSFHLTGHFFLHFFAYSASSPRPLFCLYFLGDFIQSQGFT